MPLTCVCLTVQSILIANNIIQFMDDMHLNISNSFTHLLDIESNEELNVIRHSPYSSDDELIELRMNYRTSMNILSMNCQSLHAKFDYVRLLMEKFKNNNFALQVVCLQESWFSADTNISLLRH